MNEQSWKATGLVQPIWDRLDAEKDKRGALAARMGIAPTDLTALNTGNRNMTEAMAQRIIDATPELELTLLDLRPADPAISARERRSLLDRLEEVEDLVARGFLALGVTRAQLRPTEEAHARGEEAR